MKMSILEHQFFVVAITCFVVNGVTGQLSIPVINSLMRNLENPEGLAQIANNLQSLVSQTIGTINEDDENTLSSDVDLSTEELIRKYGYPAEEYIVKTEDEYLLTLYRIPSAPRSRRQTTSSFGNPKPAVLLVHCSFISSESWLLLGKQSLGFELADAGYDVWLLDARGTNSTRHKSMSPKEPDFWDNSWHEWGIYDLPASIDFILEKTNNKKLSYIGYSAGSTAFFVMLSELPEYNDKITTMVSYAPLAYENHIRNIPMLTFSRIAVPLLNFAKVSGNVDLLSLRSPVDMVKRICQDPQFFDALCLPLLNAQYGWNNEQEDRALAPVFVSHITTTPLKLMVHYAQNAANKRFQKYKYPIPTTNLMKYGQLDPPDYNLENVKVPVAIYYSEDDPFADKQDVEDLIDILPNVAVAKEILANKFDHVSFLWGKDAPTSLYKPTIVYLNKVNRGKLYSPSTKRSRRKYYSSSEE